MGLPDPDVTEATTEQVRLLVSSQPDAAELMDELGLA